MINLNINIDKVEAANMWNDILKFLTIAVIVHLLLYSVDEYGELFDERSLKLFLYITIGVLVYYMLVKKFSSQYLFPKQPTAELQKIQEVEVPEKKKYKKSQLKPALKKGQSKKRNSKKVRFQ